MSSYLTQDVIVAQATPPGVGAIGVVRLSGAGSLAVLQPLLRQNAAEWPSHTAHFARLYEPDGRLLDEAVVTLFQAPRSYTRETVVEISCHGSPYILNRLTQLLLQNGARMAAPGEFTLRAFLNGALDLTQAEAVADLIASTNERSQQLAVKHLRGGFSSELKRLRQELVDFAALIELELDFGEEDVEFARRDQLPATIENTILTLRRLADSFSAGNAVKQGVATVIAGKPNAGKSTLLNRLLNENKAIVSAIAGTTRDVIEDRLVIEGYEFRLIDTAGLREAADEIEQQGIERSYEQLEKAQLVLYLFDYQEETEEQARQSARRLPVAPNAFVLLLSNKHDGDLPQSDTPDLLYLSAKTGENLDALKQKMVDFIKNLSQDEILLSSQRHFEALTRAVAALQSVLSALDAHLGGELLALDLRLALEPIGEITGEITNDDILGSVFSRFCIGK